MNDNLIKQLTNLSKQLGADKLISEDDKKEILNSIIAILAQFKGDVESVNVESIKTINKVLKQIQLEHDKYIIETIDATEKAKTSLSGIVNTVMKELEDVKKMYKEVMENKPKDGQDADEEYIIEEVMARITLPEVKATIVSGEELIDKINETPLEEENKIDWARIKNAPEFKNGRWSGITKGAVLKLIQESGGAGVTLKVGGTNNVDQGTLDLIAGSGMTIVDNGDGTVTFTSSGGSGTPGGSTTQLQYNNAGAFGGISGATTNGTAVTYTTGNLIATDVKASGSGGLHLHNNTGQDCFLSGVGGGINNTAYGAFKADYATATTVPYFDASKNLISSAVTPTELGYVSGVTSAIQTQLGTKENTSNKSTSTSLGTSDTLYPTQNAVKVYVDNAVTGLLDLKGDTDCSTNPNYPSALKGDAYYVTVAGKIGGASGKTVEVGDVYVAKADNAGGTEASVGTSWFVLNQNLSGVALTSGTLAQFAATTSSQLAGVISDETGTGALVFANSPTLVTPTLGVASATSLTTTGNIELGNASDTTLSRSAAGQLAVEGVDVLTVSNTKTVTNKTFTNPNINGAVITGDFQTDGLPDTDDTWTGKSTNSFNAAGTIAQFDCVYLTSSSTWALTDADAIGTAGNVLVMMAGAAGTVSNPLRVIEPGSWVRNDAWNWTVGGVLYLDTATPGGMTQTAPSGEDDAVKIVGHAVSADVIYFNPSPNWIIYKS